MDISPEIEKVLAPREKEVKILTEEEKLTIYNQYKIYISNNVDLNDSEKYDYLNLLITDKIDKINDINNLNEQMLYIEKEFFNNYSEDTELNVNDLDYIITIICNLDFNKDFYVNFIAVLGKFLIYFISIKYKDVVNDTILAMPEMFSKYVDLDVLVNRSNNFINKLLSKYNNLNNKK